MFRVCSVPVKAVPRHVAGIVSPLKQLSARSGKNALCGFASKASHVGEPQPAVDDRMIGPYPFVKAEKMNTRPQDIKYDDQQGRRNFGEVLHHKYDLLDVWSPDHIGFVPDSTAVRWNLYFIAIILGFSGFCYMIWDEPQFVRRNYPYGGLYKALGGDDETKEMFKAREDSV